MLSQETWVKASVRFPLRRAVLQAEFGRVAMTAPELDQLLQGVLSGSVDSADLASREADIVAWIGRNHPQLAGCCLHWLDVDWPRAAYRIGVSHASLPLTAEGCVPDVLDLLP
jgi:hypothetical protein